MGKKICGDEDLPLLPNDYLIQILVRLPVKSLVRFKSVCNSWRALIESSFFIDLHTTATTSKSRFGSFIVHAAVEFQRFRENALLMLSSVSESESESECVSSRSWCSGSEYGSSWGWWSIGSNGVCGRCVSRSGSGSGSGGLWWSTNDGLCVQCGQWSSYRVAEDDDQVFKVDNFLGGGSNDDDQLVLKLDNFGFPSYYNFGKIRPIGIVGSCNGLICLHDSKLGDVSLWNPATRQFRILPKSITIDGDCPHRLVAFGFDAETKDYKVVLVSVFRPTMYFGRSSKVGPMECLCRVQIYSLSTDSWRLLEGINFLPGYPFPCPDSGLYLNGSCFFMAQFLSSKQQKCVPVNNRFIISLDLTKEIIIPIQLPDHHRDQELYLCYLGDKIALFTAACYAKVNDNDTWISYEDFKFYDNDTGICSYEDFNIWVLNEHGSSSSMNKESWTELHSFRIERKKPDGLPGEWNIPRGISNDGEFALLETKGIYGLGSKMKLYNLVTKEVKKNFLSCDQVLSKAYAYEPSLVSIHTWKWLQQQQPIG